MLFYNSRMNIIGLDSLPRPAGHRYLVVTLESSGQTAYKWLPSFNPTELYMSMVTSGHPDYNTIMFPKN